MKKRQRLMLLPLLTLIAGCDAVGESMASLEFDPTIIFPPGYEIQVSGQAVPIYGFDECPSQEALFSWVFDSQPFAGSQNCVVLSEDRPSVAVMIHLPSGPVTEVWTILRETNESEGGRTYHRTRLQRPDGSPVIPAVS